MILQLITFVEQLFLSYGVWGVFLASIVEEVIAPIPSALVQMGAGFSFLESLPITLSSIGYLIVVVVLPATIGVTIGSLFIYSLAYFSGKPFLHKYGKYLGVSWNSIELAQTKFASGRTDEIILFTSRCIPIIPSVAVSAICGLMRYSFWSYILYTFLGTFVRATILGFVGWQVGSLYKIYAEKIDLAENFVISILLTVFIIYIIRRMFRKKI